MRKGFQQTFVQQKDAASDLGTWIVDAKYH